MATYAIGDLQGCRIEFETMLDTINFGKDDTLWLVGDLVNRGPDSLGTMERLLELNGQIITVLGNHDLHFLAIYYGGHSLSGSDTFDDLLGSHRVSEFAEWLRTQKMLHVDQSLGYVMAHAGIPHIWTLEQTKAYAQEVERVLRGQSETGYVDFLTALYGNEPDLWTESLEGIPRYRLIVNYLTRMRLINLQGQLDFEHKGRVEDAPVDWSPWYELKARTTMHEKLIFGHWAAIDGHTGVSDIVALDTGCVWGRRLTALCLETQEIYSVPAATSCGVNST